MQRLGPVTAVAFALVLPALGYAQSVRGAVKDQRTDVPLAGVVVLLLDSADNAVARALTNERGEYHLSSARPGQYRLRTLRIGFRPTTSAALHLAARDDVRRDLLLSGVAFSLATVRVTGRTSCRLKADSGAALLAVWEQIRTALTAAQLTTRARNLAATIVTYQRTLEPDRRRIRTQNATIRSELANRPWASLPLDSLRRSGYVVTGADGMTTYYAPDLDVLLSDAFLEDHCFTIARGSTDNRLGIEFAPGGHRRGVPEITGTLWLDRRSSELRLLEFSYANVSAEQESDAGGSLQFARLPNGAWLISQWMIRMPVLEKRAFGTELQTRISEIRTAGGELALVRRGSDTLFAGSHLDLSGVVVESASGAPVGGARIVLAGTGREALADDRGRFAVRLMLPGVYAVEVHTPAFDALGTPARSELTFTGTHESTPIVVRIPTADQLARTVCGSAMPSTRGAVIGTVHVIGDSTRRRGIPVTAEWEEVSIREGAGILVDRVRRTQETRSDALGTFRLCGLPLNTAITLRMDLPGIVPRDLDVRITADQRYRRTELFGSPSASASTASVGGKTVQLTAFVRDVAGRAVPFANVDLGGKRAVTDSAGRVVGQYAPGRDLNVAVRRLGYQPLTARIRPVEETTVNLSLMSAPGDKDDKATARQTEQLVKVGFYDRLLEYQGRRASATFVTPEDLLQREATRVTQVIEVPGIRLARVGTRVVPQAGLPRCDMGVLLDGTSISGADIDERVSIGSVAAIEVYPSAADLPSRFKVTSSGCGAVVIWSRHVETGATPRR